MQFKCLTAYQKDPDMENPEIMSLAWYAFPVAPTTSVSFSWEIDYQFVWAQSGKLAAGVIFSAGQAREADLKNDNNVNLTKFPNGAFSFENLASGGKHGTLYIHQDGTIPFNTAAVGINMGIIGAPPGSATGTFVVPAQPNITASFTPHPEYWCTFGQFTPGQVLDIGEIGEKAQIEFPPNVYHMVATLSNVSTWDVQPLQSLNEAFLARGPKKEHALLMAGGSRTVGVNKTVSLDKGSYTAKCTGSGSYKLGDAATVNFNDETNFDVTVNNTKFSNKGGTSITLTY